LADISGNYFGAMRGNVRRMKALSVYMTDSLAKQIERAAKQARRPVSSFVRLVLEDAVADSASEATKAPAPRPHASSGGERAAAS
jgi:hypothetical protein